MMQPIIFEQHLEQHGLRIDKSRFSWISCDDFIIHSLTVVHMEKVKQIGCDPYSRCNVPK